MKRNTLKKPGKAAARMLHIALPALLLCTVSILISYLQARSEEGIRAASLYKEAPSTILLCILIIAFGTLLLDRFFPAQK